MKNLWGNFNMEKSETKFWFVNISEYDHRTMGLKSNFFTSEGASCWGRLIPHRTFWWVYNMYTSMYCYCVVYSNTISTEESGTYIVVGLGWVPNSLFTRFTRATKGSAGRQTEAVQSFRQSWNNFLIGKKGVKHSMVETALDRTRR